MNSLHSRIKSVRIEAGLSQADLAQKTGVSQPTVANWENGSHIPRRAAMERIGQALGVDTIWLLSGEHSADKSPALDYLNAPIRHIPVYQWPASFEDLKDQKPDGYLPGATHKDSLFALVSNGKHAPKHALLLFDPDFTTILQDDLCLQDTESGLSIEKHDVASGELTISARLSATLIQH